MRDINATDEQIINALMTGYELSREEAPEKLTRGRKKQNGIDS